MVRDNRWGSDARGAHQAFQAINPVESRLVASVGPIMSKSRLPIVVLVSSGMRQKMRPVAKAYPAAAAIDASR
jgi:hypothetical protein